MAAPKGNQFYKLVERPGRPPRFETPDEAWDKFVEYASWCVKHPIKRVDVVKSGEYAGTQISAKVPRPFTMEGVYNYLNINADTFKNYEGTGTDTGESHKDFPETFTRIRLAVRQQKLEGALSGNYNTNLVAKELDIADRLDLTSGGKEIKNIISFGGQDVEI